MAVTTPVRIREGTLLVFFFDCAGLYLRNVAFAKCS